MNQPKDRRRARSQGRRLNAGHHQPSNDQILPRMIAFINNLAHGCIRLRDLQERFITFSIPSLWSFVRMNHSNFQIERKDGCQDWNTPSNNDVIWVKTDLRLCENHCRKGKHCLGECGKLHLCRTFLLLGDMCCPFQKSGKVCAFGHSLQTNHNGNLLNAHNLSFLLESELRCLFRRRICRSVSTMPQICIYYNSKGGKRCSNKQCKSLHLCLDFVLEKCHGLCSKNHSMSSEQVAFTLDLFAIDKSWPNDLVLEDLRCIMKKRIRHNSDVSSVVSADSHDHDQADDDSDNEWNGNAGAYAERTNNSQNARVAHCCSHCEEMRTEMIRMKEKMEDLQEQLDHMKTSNGRNQSLEEPGKVDVQLSTDEKEKLAEQLFPIVKEMHPELAENITRMILDMDKSQLKEILTSQVLLRTKIKEAVRFLSTF